MPNTVVLIPPLLMPRYGMKPLQWRLERSGFRTRLFGYPSYRRTIPENAKLLAEFLAELGEERVDVVTFSMGGVVLRWCSNFFDHPRLDRVVMIGPPNRGARMADLTDEVLGLGFPLLFGRCARQLRTGDRGLCESAGLLPEDTEIGIIAGGTGRPTGFNPLIGRDNDRVVAVDETLLPGMKDFALFRLPHGPMIFAKETAAATGRFLGSGSFGEYSRPVPVTLAESA